MAERPTDKAKKDLAAGNAALPTIEQQLEFERLLTTLSAKFVNLPASDVDEEIVHGLEMLVTALVCDRAVLSTYDEKNRTLVTTHSWAVDGIVPIAPMTVASQGSEAVMDLVTGKVFQYASLDELPAGSRERQFFEALGTRSHITVPLVVGGRLLGALSCATLNSERDWPDSLVKRLRLIGAVFANALERARAENERRQLRIELEHAARVTSMGELTAGLAHELRQPLTAILSNAQAAKRFLADSEPNVSEVQEILSDIVSDNKRAVEVMQRLRDFMKKTDVHVVALDVNSVITEVLSLVNSDIMIKNILVKSELDPELPLVRADRVQLQQVLLNLLMNASESMLKVEPGTRVLTVSTAPFADGNVEIAVADTGAGMDDRVMQHVFERFFTTKPDGMGMGLSINRSIVEAHGGRLWVENNDAAGVTFRFTLPEDCDE